MNIAAIFVPLFLGASTVLQTGLNRQMAEHYGLAQAAFYSNLVTLILSGIILLSAYLWPDLFPPLFKFKETQQSFRWWFIFPGILGFFIVVLCPYAVSKFGAAQFFISFIAAQMIASAAWDHWIEKMPFEPLRFFGLILSFIGAILVAI